jgi:hypothetical protein
MIGIYGTGSDDWRCPGELLVIIMLMNSLRHSRLILAFENVRCVRDDPDCIGGHPFEHLNICLVRKVSKHLREAAHDLLVNVRQVGGLPQGVAIVIIQGDSPVVCLAKIFVVCLVR